MKSRSDALADLSDDVLLVRYGNGDIAAAEMLTERHAPRIVAYAARLMADRTEAEDVAQDAMLRLWRIAPDWRRGEAQVSTWLYRVTTNLCTDRLRKQRRTAPLEAAGDPEDERQGAVADMIAKDRARALEAALAELPDRQRQAVVLRHIEGLSNPEIAAVMDIGIEAVESLTARGKRALAARLEPARQELGFNDG